MAENVGGIFYTVGYDLQQLVNGRRVIDRETAGAARSFNVITAAVKILAAALATLKFAETADELRMLQARVDVAAGSIQAGAAAMTQLEDISRRTNSALASNVTVFTRLNSSIKQMGGAEADTLRVTELLAKAITVSGATAAEKTSAMIQFGQALGSGKLAGDELRSLLENAPYLMQQLAAGIGVPVGALKGLGEQGKLTSDVVVKALSAAADRINADFAQFPKTLDAGLTQAEDAARRAVKTLDDVSGASAVLTGVASGAAKSLDDLVAALGGVDKAGNKLSREKAIEEWSARTRTFLTYVADGADLAWQTLSILGRNVAFVFTSIGREIGGIGAQVAAVLRGDFAGARAIGEDMRADAEQRRKELDDADAKTLASRKLWGEQMREAAAQASVEDRGFRPTGKASKLTPAVDPEEQRKLAARRAAAQAYYEGLLADTQVGLAKINGEEQKALAVNEAKLQQDNKNADIYAKAKAAIVAKYARERALYEEQQAQEVAAFNIAITIDEQAKIEATRAEAFRTADAQVNLGVKTFAEGERLKTLAAMQAADAMRALQSRNLGTITGTLQIRADGGDRQAQEDLIVAQATQALQANSEAREKDIENLQIYADREVAILAAMNLRIAVLRNQRVQDDLQGRAALLGGAAGFFDQLAELQKHSEGEQSGAYKAAFAASKAFALAQGIVNLYSAALQAMADPSALTPAQKFANYAAVFAAGGSLLATISSAKYGGGRQYGGPVDAGSLYRINETGRPEMFTASNGAQYMLPTASGNVTPAGGGGFVQEINVHNYAGDDIQTSTRDNGRIVDIAVRRAKAEIAGDIAQNRGEVWSSLVGNSNTRGRL